MNKPETYDLQTFEQHFATLEDTLHKIVLEVTEDRREWLRYKIGNSLLFGAGASFFYYSLAPTRNEASLNEAICLRKAAIPFYGENEDRMAADAEGCCRYYSPKDPVSVDRKKPQSDMPPALKKRAKERVKRAQNKFETRTRIAPDLRGFLDGAAYDKIDLQPSEQAGHRALVNISKAMASMQERVEQDILSNGDKWDDADARGDKQKKDYWFSEIEIAELDGKMLADRVKQYGWDVTA